MSSKIKLKSTRKMLSILMAFMLSVCMVTAFSTQVSAASSANEKVKAVGDSVLQVRMIYQPDDEDIAIVSSGSCFLINTTTALSCAHIFTFDEDFVTYAQACYGDDHVVNEKNITGYEILVNGGVPVSATLKKVNETADYAVIKLDETVSRPIVKLGYSSELSVTQQIYTVGYPDEIVRMQDSNTFTSDRITITDSTIANISVTNGVDIITHNAALNEGNSGGPIVDEDGNVVGINQYSTDDKYYMAAAIDQIVALLDDLDIEYERASGSTVTDTDEDENEEEEEEEVTTEEVTIAPTTQAIQPSASASIADTQDDSADLTKLIIIIAIVVLIIVVVVVVILIILSNKKKASEKIPTQQKANTVMPGPGISQMPPKNDFKPSQPPYGQPYNRPTAPQQTPGTIPSSEGAGETSVLNDGAGETTVLGNQSTGFKMLRKRNNENIVINKPEFIIGKERRRVDYCVSDNNSISRVHAKIRVRAGRCYITDLGSTNCTYVNGSKLSANQEVILSKGDQIKISDEEFEFLG